MKKISIDKEKEILNLYLKNRLPTTKIGLLVGISSTCVSNIIKRNGYNPRNISESKKGIRRGSKLPVNKIINLYNQGHPSTKISEIIGCSKRSVLNILNDNNINLRAPGWDKNYKNSFEDKIKKLYLSGKSINEVANDIKASYGGVNKILKKLKIIRTEKRFKGMTGKFQSIEAKDKFRKTRQHRKEEGLYDHIYLKRTGYTYSDFQKRLPEFRKYFQKVRSITNNQPINKLENFEKRGKTGCLGAYHLDHKYSIIEGFRNDIAPEIIGNISNLHMITWEVNVVKQGDCLITLESLKKLIELGC